ncbi:MAG: hypothetical protein H0U25_06210 [Thermoleophilaceae bacterium]|nr:hypothetical protein [Thermoleophilaceae bacterium]
MAFVGRRRALERARLAVDAGQHVLILSEHGVGKTALAKRLRPDAIYLAQVSPIKELLSALLLECWKRGWYEGNGDDDPAAAEKAIRRLPARDQANLCAAALFERGAVLVLDDFERASVQIMVIVRRLADIVTIVACATGIRPAQAPLLSSRFERVELPRLARAESEELVDKLLVEQRATMKPRELMALRRHVLEQSQGVPAVMHELVGRARRKGEVSLRSVQREQISAHRTVDMTPLLVVAACVLVALRVALRGVGDHDLTVLMGGSGALFMLVRTFAGRLSQGRRRP